MRYFNLIIMILCMMNSLSVIADELSVITDYQVYEPQIQRQMVYEGQYGQGTFAYNHCASIEYFNDEFYVVWQANYENMEGWPGRQIYLSKSKDIITWSAPVHFVGEGSVNPIIPSVEKSEMQSQPNLMKYSEDELWCIWSIRGFPEDKDNAGTYLSRLKKGQNRWTNERIWLTSEIEGRRAYAYPSQNPVMLSSGRVIVPVTFDTSQTLKSARYPVMYNAFLYTDDGGKNWQCSNFISTPHNLTGQWEPCAHQQADGKVRGFYRNFSSLKLDSDKWLQTSVATGVEKGQPLTFDPDPEYSFIETANTRMHCIKLASGRYTLFHHDIYTESRGYHSRFNGALFFSRTGEDDFVAAAGFSKAGEIVAYPQGVEVDGNIYVAYTLGGINVPRSILVAKIPSPLSNTRYIWPRDKDVVGPEDLELIKEKPYNWEKRNRQYQFTKPYKDVSGGKDVLVFKERGTAGVEIDPVRFDKDQSLVLSMDVKINKLQEVGNLILCSFGDQIPIRVGMPSGRPGLLYAYSDEQWQKVGSFEINKWNHLEICYNPDTFEISINHENPVEFGNPLRNPNRRLYLGDGYEIDEFESNRDSEFLVDLSSFTTKIVSNKSNQKSRQEN
jgi:hypothetical protein